jgi:hypothetical protein
LLTGAAATTPTGLVNALDGGIATFTEKTMTATDPVKEELRGTLMAAVNALNNAADWLTESNHRIKSDADCLRAMAQIGQRTLDNTRSANGLPSTELEAALRGLEMFFKRPDENPVGKFDRIAMAYYAETGNAPPGKSWPEEIDNETPEEKRERFEAWVDGKAAAARAILSRIVCAE